MKRGRVGNGSSKYDFDNGASLDEDVAITISKINTFKKNFKDLLIESLRDLSITQIRNSIVDVLEEVGFMTKNEVKHYENK